MKIVFYKVRKNDDDGSFESVPSASTEDARTDQVDVIETFKMRGYREIFNNDVKKGYAILNPFTIKIVDCEYDELNQDYVDFAENTNVPIPVDVPDIPDAVLIDVSDDPDNVPVKTVVDPNSLTGELLEVNKFGYYVKDYALLKSLGII